MKKYILKLAVLSLALTSCEKWTSTESIKEDFEKVALDNLKEVKNEAKWSKEAEITAESKLALEDYWQQLTEYKKKAWLNGGDAVGQKPMFYFWYDGSAWTTTPGIPKSWLQSLPDSLTAISIWGGLGGIRPDQLSENRKKDIEIFQKKGSKILMCWQTPSVGTALPGKLNDPSSDGFRYFREKYPFDTHYSQWPELYARELSRYIIALGLDGYDVDWETCGDHGHVSEEGTPLMIDDNHYENIGKFVIEMAKYFGPVGPDHATTSQAEREANLVALFTPETAGFDPREREFIEEMKPFLKADYAQKRYYFCADVPCGVAPIFGRHSATPITPISDNVLAKYFDKHYMQDYTRNGVNLSGSFPPMLGGPWYNSTSANYQAGQFDVVKQKALDIKTKKVWGFGAYHGATDYANTGDGGLFKRFFSEKRNYNRYAFTREVIRIADPRSSYFNTKEIEPIIILP